MEELSARNRTAASSKWRDATGLTGPVGEDPRAGAIRAGPVDPQGSARPVSGAINKPGPTACKQTLWGHLRRRLGAFPV